MGPAYADDPTGVRLARLAERSGWTRIERRIATSFLLDIPEVRREAAWPRNSTLRKNRWFEKELAKSGALDWRFVTGDGWTGLVFDELAAIEGKRSEERRVGKEGFVRGDSGCARIHDKKKVDRNRRNT